MTNTARLYQLENNHFHNGVWVARRLGQKKETPFRYGYTTIKDTSGTPYIHGMQGSTSTRVLETVEKHDFRVGDRVQLSDGTFGEVTNIQRKYIEEKQLRFIKAEMADVATTIVLRAIEGAK